jgi:hypothetical protein
MKIIDRIKANYQIIGLVLLLMILLKQCGTSSSVAKLEKQAKAQSGLLDSMCTKNELQRSLEIEGLRAEKRMIQSTDRKMMDVNRQSEIDEQIKKLESSK